MQSANVYIDIETYCAVHWLVVDEDNLFIRSLTLDSKRIKAGMSIAGSLQ
jgi:hypothetical protein